MSNNAKVKVKYAFLKFTDNKIPMEDVWILETLHTIFSKSVSEPKCTVSTFDEKVKTLPVCEFNHTQKGGWTRYYFKSNCL